MRKITEHTVYGDSANHQIDITVLDDPGPGGANHVYQVSGPSHALDLILAFQNGPIKEAGVNGVTHEALLAIILDRMRGFQTGQYACRENAIVITHLETALMFLKKRTEDRIKRGVEGTHAK